MLTVEMLLKLAPNAPKPAACVDALNAAMDRFGIDTPKRQAHFLAQLVHESGQLTAVREGFNYSAAGLLKTFPKYFKNLVDAQFYERQPAKIANFVYANRMGNRDEKSGDGYRNRGAGWMQITGADNLRQCGAELGITCDVGDYLATVNGSALSACWFWWKSGCNRFADMGNVDAVSDLINIGHRTDKVGDSIGYDKRLMLTKVALKVFECN